MRYYSIGGNPTGADLSEAVMSTYAADGCMYMPERLPRIPDAFFNNFAGMTFAEIAYVTGNLLFGDDLGSATVKNAVSRAFNFDVPLRHVGDGIYALELFHGPTLSVKDFGARFMAEVVRDMRARSGMKGRRLHVVTATTGNTGSAVANAFAGISGVEVYVLFPRGKSGRQLEMQFVTLGGNVHALEVQGTIDDCRRMAREAFADTSLKEQALLTSAGSANIVRLLPHIFTYFYGLAKMHERLDIRPSEITVAVPAGNLSNVTAAVAARRMGLPMGNIVACENANGFLTQYLETGIIPATAAAVPTLAYAADKAVPTNFDRLMWLCGNSASGMRREIAAVSCTDADIITAVNSCYDRYGYNIDPHTALAWRGATQYAGKNAPCLLMATAHPAKSLAAMNAITGRAMDLPLQLTRFMSGTDMRRRIQPDYKELKEIILRNN